MMYHATKSLGRLADIFLSGNLGLDYGLLGDTDKGVYLCDNEEDSNIYGYVVLHIDDSKIDKSKLEEGEANGEYYHNGLIPFEWIKAVSLRPCDRLGMEFYNLFGKEGKDINWKEWFNKGEELRGKYTPKETFVLRVN